MVVINYSNSGSHLVGAERVRPFSIRQCKTLSKETKLGPKDCNMRSKHVCRGSLGVRLASCISAPFCQHGMRHSSECRCSVEVSPSTPQRIGVLGGGQLGKMLGIAAARMGIDLKVLDPTENCPAASVAGHVVGDFSDAETVRSFVTDEDVLTVEIEHVDAAAMRDVRDSAKIDVEPTPETLEIIQDKFKQKEHFNHKAKIKVTSYIDVEGEGTGDLATMVLGLPFMLKSKRWAYDGRGNVVVKKLSELEDAARSLGGYEKGLYGEKWVDFTKEVAVMVAKTKGGEVVSFPVTETIHKDSILHVTQTPAQIPEELLEKAKELAEQAVASLEGAGIFGVEMFVMKGGELALNEVAPRPHNSGHYTIEACSTSQFEQHLRAISGLPLGDSSLNVKSSVMLNILGEADGEEGVQAAKEILDKAYKVPGAAVHWYGKKGVSTKRKIGHITLVGNSAEETTERLAMINEDAAQSLRKSAEAFEEDWKKVLEARKKEEEEGGSSGGSGPPILACRVEHVDAPVDHAREPLVPSHQPDSLVEDSLLQYSRNRRTTCQGETTFIEAAAASPSKHCVLASSVVAARKDQSGSAQVAVIMGSDSDLPTMQAAADVLKEFGIPREVTIVSAHRTPDRMLDFARGAHKRGIKVIIAGAGGAAHLPGMVASLTPLPVIGVPVTPKGSHLDGLDALMSIVQMPKGVPVATVAIGNAANAGLLAARILASSDEALLQKMLDYQETMKTIVLQKAAKMEKDQQ